MQSCLAYAFIRFTIGRGVAALRASPPLEEIGSKVIARVTQKSRGRLSDSFCAYLALAGGFGPTAEFRGI